LKPEHTKNRLLGHWGSSPGLAFIYIHLSRLIKKVDLDMIFMAGPGQGGSRCSGTLLLEGTYSEIYPDIRDGAVLPILDLNGYKINNPTLLPRITHEELEDLVRNYGWTPHFVEGSDGRKHAQAMAAAIEPLMC
jgi:phosphoketolase